MNQVPCFCREGIQFLEGRHLFTNRDETIEITKAVRGVSSEGFITIVHPQARAGATFQPLGL